MYVSDSEKIARGIALARAEDRELDDLTAKIIAAQYHDGSARSLAFLSTGRISSTTHGSRTSDLWRAFAGDYEARPTDEREALDWFGTYLLNRPNREEVEGWADLSW